MSESLQQLEQPVDHEALRLRMVTLHGKEDGLLDAGRFQRLLRQANDAEVVDVKKVGDDAYEVTHTAMEAQTRKAIESSAAQVREKEPVKKRAAKEEVAETTTEGPKRTSRYRRGSRSPSGSPAGPGDVPMVGVVSVGKAAASKKKKATKTPAKKAKKAKKKTGKKAAKKGGAAPKARKPSTKATKAPRRSKAPAKAKAAKAKAKRAAPAATADA